MRLLVATPTTIVEDRRDLRHIRAEDETGAFGIMDGHADFLTALTACVVIWDDRADRTGFVVVGGGVLVVRNGNEVEIATRQAVRGDDVGTLDEALVAHLDIAERSEEMSRTTSSRLHLATIRQIQRVLDAGRQAQLTVPTTGQATSATGRGTQGGDHGRSA